MREIAMDIQDVEYDERPETRVNNAGVKIRPPADKPAPEVEPEPDSPDKQQENFEKALTRLPPG